MSVAQQLASVHDVFSDLLVRLQAASLVHAKAAISQVQQQWDGPAPVGSWSGNPLELDTLADAFDRDEVNDEYVTCLTSVPPGTTGDVSSLRMQVDYVAGAERAYRTRHCSSIRAAMHAAARRQGHGQDGGVYTVIGRQAQSLIDRGAPE